MVAKYPPKIQEALSVPAEERSPFQRLIYYKVKPFHDPDSYLYQAPTTSVLKKLSEEEKERWEKLQARLDAFSDLHPGRLPIGVGIVAVGREAPRTYILSGGAHDAHGREVQPGFLTLLAPGPAKIIAPEGLQSSGRRSALANWLVDPANPLTARVMVNRIWHSYFSRGLVETPSNLGIIGADPSHPQLLDWLANEFIRNGWSIKDMHRLIMNSNTYQQASLYRGEAARIDSENQLMWRFPRQRLEGEIIRDAALAVSGLLNPKIGGPSVFPRLPPGIVIRGGWTVAENPAERNRRSIYVFVRRNTRYPLFQVFDMPDTHESCPRRDTTTNPLQALTMLNSEMVLEWAQAFAGRVLFSAGREAEAQIETAYRLAYSRPPTTPEMKTALRFLKLQRTIIAERASEGQDLILPLMNPYHHDPIDRAALVDFCHMIINSNEFVYRN